MARTKRTQDKKLKQQFREKMSSSYVYFPVNTVWKERVQLLLNLKRTKTQNINQTTDVLSLQLSRPATYQTITGDGNCFFAALSYIICGHQTFHDIIRHKICNHFIQNQNDLKCYLPPEYKGNANTYLLKTGMRENGTWATEVEIFTASHLLQTDIYTYTKSGVHWNFSSSLQTYLCDQLKKGTQKMREVEDKEKARKKCTTNQQNMENKKIKAIRNKLHKQKKNRNERLRYSIDKVYMENKKEE
ncbi:unnamed protein product [Mytilus coruscus]|uniref:OTU domain-containing protein n=1 Tax=Mytilus coruscus TaxID=42192 RepID=A0A6J8BXI9_MYTCO|nr:unnamed protein product [Mytilus coruscus]